MRNTHIVEPIIWECSACSWAGVFNVMEGTSNDDIRTRLAAEHTELSPSCADPSKVTWRFGESIDIAPDEEKPPRS